MERLPHGLRPLTRLSYFLDAQLYGVQAAGFLSTNLLLHALTVALVFALARRRLGNTGALLAALAFAVQPANAEVVAYVSGRSTGLMTPLLLGGLLLYDQGKRPAALLLFSLACLAKEHALIFPALVLAWELTRAPSRAGVAREITVVTMLAAAILARSALPRRLPNVAEPFVGRQIDRRESARKRSRDSSDAVAVGASLGALGRSRLRSARAAGSIDRRNAIAARRCRRGDRTSPSASDAGARDCLAIDCTAADELHCSPRPTS